MERQQFHSQANHNSFCWMGSKESAKKKEKRKKKKKRQSPIGTYGVI
jgi:hypothetical protein